MKDKTLANETKYIDLILHFPSSDDYLLRLKTADLLENCKANRANMEVKKVVISNPFFGLRTFKVYNPPPKIEDGKYVVMLNYPGMQSYLRAYSIEEEKIEGMGWINVQN